MPLEKIEERVIRDDASGRVVERTIQRFDQNGSATAPERIVIEQQGSTTRSTTYRGDINGAFHVVERSLTETRKSGSTESSETTVERPTVNDSMETVEKISVVKTEVPGGFQQSAVTYRLGADGFYEALRLVTNHQKEAARTRDETAEYEVGSSGRLELHSQTVISTTLRPDGSALEVVDVFGQSVPGLAGTEGSPLKLMERDTTQRRLAADGSVRETFSVQRPSLADPGVLGPSAIVSETVCRGKCLP